MRWIWIMATAVALHSAQVVEVGDKFKHSDQCKSCHNPIVKEWEHSWHAKSHYENDEYFRKSIDYVARKTSGKSLNSVIVECAACHNPRISVTSTNAEYDAISIMKLDAGSAVNQALKSDTIAEGINCVVCHNIDRIHDDLSADKRGIHRVSWMPTGKMSGPYADAKSPYHKVEERDFMASNPNQLCFVCHANDTSEEGHRFVEMQAEYKSGGKQCVECHMGPRKEGVAATLRLSDGKPHTRMVRSHGFVGGHVESLWKGALGMTTRSQNGGLEITLNNPQPHPLPSGFGSREIVIEVAYQNGAQALKTETVSITSRYVSKRGKPTIPHLAAKTVEHDFIPAEGAKTYRFAIPSGARNAVVTVYYRLVNDEVKRLLDLRDPIWSKKMVIQKAKVAL